MSWAHLKTFVWLRWRLLANQNRRAGAASTVLTVIFAVGMVAGGLFGLIAGFVIGAFALTDSPPIVSMAIWDGAIAGFTFFWIVGLMSELQRSEILTFDRFLHLPVSPTGAFLINYLGSSFSLSLVWFLPAMTGFSIGRVVAQGPRMLVLFPLIATFFVMVTALTYQFRGWLAGMMTNPRRRRAIVAGVTVLFILVFQIPNLLTNFGPGAVARRTVRQERREEVQRLDQELADGRITQEEYDRQRSALPRSPGPFPRIDETFLRQANMIVPLGWLAYGADGAGRSRVWPPLAAMLGMGLIGAASLTRAYRTTIRLYTGDFDRSRRRSRSAVTAVAEPSRTAGSVLLVERRLRWLPDRVSAIALANLRALLRAPEAKMMLLTPVIMIIIFSRTFAAGSDMPSELILPLIASGIAAFILIIGLMGFVANQFGFDRNGFRAYVLLPASRRDILMGKNLALLPFALGLMLVAVSLFAWFRPMRIDHLLAVLIGMIPMYLVFSIGGNLLSILAPMSLRTGSGMPARNQGLKMLFRFLFMPAIGTALTLTLLPLGIEALLTLGAGIQWVPAFLLFGIIQAALMVWIYVRVLDWQGTLLQSREQKILEVVGKRTE